VRVAVAGGTGLVGAYVVEALRTGGHDAVVLARSHGVDLSSGEGLDERLAGAEAVVDVTNTPDTDPAAARDFFSTVTRHLLAGEARAGVSHHVLLSIADIDRVAGNGHYDGKRAQEAWVRTAGRPFTILRATQLFELAEMVVGWTRKGDVAIVPPLLVQPVAASDVGAELAELALGPPRGVARDLAGPEPQDLLDMARRALAARGDTVALVPSWTRGPFGAEMAGDVLLAADDARIAPTTFDEWLVEHTQTVNS
jgi:uncharacterized protein YbjT (DUF2867 family)